jgi:hypothetical protein
MRSLSGSLHLIYGKILSVDVF